ncbi:membrane-anchored ubiquitin-fold protein 3-like isoform X1 [Gossypium australe]|uniref:Membrane-anchored ubiquitin-fold protein 3-like isoform X1 n=1 Tax=Gossypium australe TaxID=47621 RepID=A0A5B6UK38_9ROSI|nr:membrane-anchored ubiquitin-fold protein 3-like isoform X1 [Gossypium australe]
MHDGEPCLGTRLHVKTKCTPNWKDKCLCIKCYPLLIMKCFLLQLNCRAEICLELDLPSLFKPVQLS